MDMAQFWCLMLLQLLVAMSQNTTAASTSTTTTSTDASTSTTTTSTDAPTTKSTIKASVESSTPAPTTTTTTMTTTTSTMAPTTEAPALGVDCSNKSGNWCNTAVSGAVECGAGNKCRCVSGHFQVNNTMCIPDIDLVPTSLTTSEVTNSSFDISWSQKDNVKDLNLAYTVSAKSAYNSQGLSEVACGLHSSDRKATCSGLTSGYKYNVTVTTTYGTNHSGFAVKQESTVPSIPGVLNISSSNFSASNLVLVWTSSSGRADLYNVKVTKSNTSIEVFNESTNDTNPQITIAGLTAGTHYKVFIAALSYGESSPKREDSFRTDTEVPGPPTGLTVVSHTVNSIKISWTITDHPNGAIQGHKVCIKYKVYSDEQYKELVCVNTTGASVIEFERANLTAGTFYQFDVYTINDMFVSSNSASIKQLTQQSVPEKVNELKATPNDTLIKVTWKRPLQPNGNITAYKIQWTRLPDQQNCTAYLKSSETSTMPNTTCYHNISDPDNIAVNQDDMEYTMIQLMPHTKYRIQVWAYTSVGQGAVDSKTTETSISVPDPVTDVIAEVLNATAVNVSWTISGVNPGPVNYTVMTNNMVNNDKSQQSCSIQGYNSSSCVVPDLEEYWRYTFSVFASTDAGTSNPTLSDSIITEEAEPGPISRLSYKLFNESDSCDATIVQIDWEEPNLLERNSLIERYHFAFQGPPSYRHDVPNPDPYSATNRKFMENLTDLVPEKSYSWRIYAESKHGKEGQETTITVHQGVCAPPDWESKDLQLVEEKVSTASSVTIKLPVTFFEKSQQGSIQEMGLIILPMESQYFDETSNIDVKKLNNWKSSQSSKFQQEYKVTISGKVDGEFRIGDSECGVAVDGFCNGHLPEQFSFKLAAYVCTKRTGNPLCTISSPFGPFATMKRQEPEEGSEAWVIVVSVLIVLVAFVGAFAFLWYKRIIDPKSWLTAGKGTNDEPPFTPIDMIDKNRPIPLSRYSIALEEMHKDTNLQLSDQYDDINRIGQIVCDTSTTDNAKLESNTPKNRWVNILPFDHSRVKLQQIDEDDPTSDYINANYIPGFYSQRDYIATQGPLPGTIDDFWRMIWEHNVLVIVMLTQCKEGNRVKCEKYWPDELREPKQYGEVVVNPTSISQLDKYNISIFDVSVNGQQQRQVIHFHYLDFPDFSANVEFDHFVNFVRTVRNHVPREMTGPMVIHCSAGVGRTGTFIATDRLNLYLNSDKFDENDEVDIFGIVVSMRENRVAMVQTESQYIMIHDCFEKMFEDKKKSMQMTDSEENLYANQGFDPFPEVLYENVSATQQQTEL